MELQDYLRVVRQRWISILIVTLAGLTAAAGLTLLQTPQYEARSQLFVSVKGNSSAADLTQGNSFAEKRVTSYVTLATSPRVLQAVADELELAGGAGQLTGRVTASTPTQTVLIDIKALSPEPQEAARIANSTAAQLIRAVNAVEDVSLVRLSVFQDASAPSTPSSPRVPVNLAVGLVLGLLLGTGLAVLRQVLDTRLRSQEDIERIANAGVLGTFAYEAALEDSPLVTQGDVYSPRAESFRQLRTHLHFTNIEGGSQSVVVSSSIPGEGKTSTSVNLAIMLAESGVRVLLVDADLRRPRVAKFLDLESSVGLTNVLAHTVDVEHAIQQWGPGGALDVLTAGRFAPNPSELLGSPRMEKLLSDMKSQYEVVIIDAPPLLPVTDPAVLGSMASGILLVVAADGRTHSTELDSAVKNIKAVNASLLGIVINRLPTVHGIQGYYDYRPEVPQMQRRASTRRRLAATRNES